MESKIKTGRTGISQINNKFFRPVVSLVTTPKAIEGDSRFIIKGAAKINADVVKVKKDKVEGGNPNAEVTPCFIYFHGGGVVAGNAERIV
mgnify:CR=1 FL=1